MSREPTSDELADLDAEAQAEATQPQDQAGDSLEDLFAEAQAGRANVERKLRRSQRSVDPSLREALDAAAKKMRELYSNPENWRRSRGLVLIDKETQTVIGNYSEWLHRTAAGPRRLVREHQPIQIDGQEVVEGFLGHRLEEQLRGLTWDREMPLTCHITLDEVQVEAPNVPVRLLIQFNSVVRVELTREIQFASASGNVLLILPTGTNVWEAANSDTKAVMRKAVLV